jgi:thiol-disulfide isomerase/thioredoxin
MPEIGRWQRNYVAAFTMAVISRGTAAAAQLKTSAHGITSVLLQQDNEVSRTYQAHGTPSAVIVRPNGTIGSPLAAGGDAIRALVTKEAGGDLQLLPPVPVIGGNGANGHHHGHDHLAPLASADSTTRPNMGDMAPPLQLPDLNGQHVNLPQFLGNRTLVLFWNPGCGYCQQMLPDLRAWEEAKLEGAPKLLVVSTGSVEANRALGLHSPILLEPSFSAGVAFGVSGTPSAVLVDAQGKIASPVAVGAQAVLSLAGSGELSPNLAST